jgi:hypothetical protein
MLFISLKEILRRILPPTLLNGLLLAVEPNMSPSSILILSALGFAVMGDLAWAAGRPALKLKSSRKLSRWLANLTSALSKSNSEKLSPPLPFVGALIVTLLRLLSGVSGSIDSLLSRFQEFVLEWRAVARAVAPTFWVGAGPSPSLPSSMVTSTDGEAGPAPFADCGEKAALL